MLHRAGRPRNPSGTNLCDRLALVPCRVIAQAMGLSTSAVQKIEKRALARVRTALRRLGYDGSEVPYVVHALSGYGDDHLPSKNRRNRKEYDRRRWLRAKAARGRS
jgi:hypothetical protein